MADKLKLLDRFMAPIIVGLVVVGGVMAITMCNGEIIIFIDPPSIVVVIFGSMLIMSLVGHTAPRHQVLDRFWTLPIWFGLAFCLMQVQITLGHWDNAESVAMGLRTCIVTLVHGVVFGACILKPLAIYSVWQYEARTDDNKAIGLLPKDILFGFLKAIIIIMLLMIFQMIFMAIAMLVSGGNLNIIRN
jgi:hypothetical protein